MITEKMSKKSPQGGHDGKKGKWNTNLDESIERLCKAVEYELLPSCF